MVDEQKTWVQDVKVIGIFVTIFVLGGGSLIGFGRWLFDLQSNAMAQTQHKEIIKELKVEDEKIVKQARVELKQHEDRILVQMKTNRIEQREDTKETRRRINRALEEAKNGN